MRQAGIIAAAGIVALETMINRLADDHIRARNLAAGLSEIPQILLDPGRPATNMVFFNLIDRVRWSVEEIEARMKEQGVLVHATGHRRFRLVTHCWIDDAAVQKTLDAFRVALS